MRPAVFLDRDGVINRAPVRDGVPQSPASIEDVEILPGVREALARLKAANYALIGVTNQPNIARGRTTRATVDAIHALLLDTLPLDEMRVCPHDDRDQCRCRKPLPGLLLQPPLYAIDRSVMIGDRWRDIEAGRAAGCRATILVDHGYGEALPHDPDLRVGSLPEAAEWILRLPSR
jgi:D-glycero-D-manno-heptose 1,7-bisphosphate phosphatase